MDLCFENGLHQFYFVMVLFLYFTFSLHPPAHSNDFLFLVPYENLYESYNGSSRLASRSWRKALR